MTAAVIITTYNQPLWLAKTLWGYACQTTHDFQVVIADDGSGEETRALIENARGEFAGRLQHVWHEDSGFRKCEILNRAIVAVDADYLIFTDGDCIPRRDFVQTHIALAEEGRFLSGGVIWLPRVLSHAITRDDVVSGRFARAAWLREHGWVGGRHRLRLVRNQTAARVLDTITPTGATFNGHNASVWRDALLEVNGFDAEMGYGGLDRALGERLENLGCKGKRVRHRALCFHLDHDRPYRNPEVVQRNRELRARIRRAGLVRAQRGIAELTNAPDGAS
ncbi:MAG TPA: glycosyltransferase family 2 protein [Longimicrobiales bacterium]|nr:glycosyltransferase family 2 protein [Longimicrobiales bacterium]